MNSLDLTCCFTFFMLLASAALLFVLSTITVAMGDTVISLG